MLTAMTWAVTIVLIVGYVIGSIPVAVIVAERHGLADPRTLGDRNPGFWNMRESFGDSIAAPVFGGDVLKGGIAAIVGVIAAGSGEWWMPYVAGGAAMVGHAWPVFAGFRGGRSVLTFVGAAVVCAPIPAMLAIIATGSVWAARRELAIAARVGVAAFPFLQLATEGWRRTAASGVLMTFVGLRFRQAAVTERRTQRRPGRAIGHQDG